MRFKAILKKYNVTQNELAERLQINRVSVCRLLSEDNDIRLSTIKKIADAVGCSPAELIDDGATDCTFNAPSDITLSCPHCGQPIKLSIAHE